MRKIISIVAAVVIILTFVLSVSIVPTGYTGVRVTFGQVDPIVVQGFNWKIPFVQSIKKINNQFQDTIFKDQIWSETSERTSLFYENITVTYQINSEKSAWIYANINDYKKNLISSAIVASATKASSKTVNSTDATNRAIIEPLVQEYLQKAIDEKYGENVVYISRVTITNVDFDESYNQAIAAKQSAQLAYEKQEIENKKSVEIAEAQALVTLRQAQATADAQIIKAKSDAEARLINANAETEARKLKNTTLTDNILKEIFYSKWDGKLPVMIGSDENILDISKIVE